MMSFFLFFSLLIIFFKTTRNIEENMENRRIMMVNSLLDDIINNNNYCKLIEYINDNNSCFKLINYINGIKNNYQICNRGYGNRYYDNIYKNYKDKDNLYKGKDNMYKGKDYHIYNMYKHDNVYNKNSIADMLSNDRTGKISDNKLCVNLLFGNGKEVEEYNRYLKNDNNKNIIYFVKYKYGIEKMNNGKINVLKAKRTNPRLCNINNKKIKSEYDNKRIGVNNKSYELFEDKKKIKNSGTKEIKKIKTYEYNIKNIRNIDLLYNKSVVIMLKYKRYIYNIYSIVNSYIIKIMNYIPDIVKRLNLKDRIVWDKFRNELVIIKKSKIMNNIEFIRKLNNKVNNVIKSKIVNTQEILKEYKKIKQKIKSAQKEDKNMKKLFEKIKTKDKSKIKNISYFNVKDLIFHKSVENDCIVSRVYNKSVSNTSLYHCYINMMVFGKKTHSFKNSNYYVRSIPVITCPNLKNTYQLRMVCICRPEQNKRMFKYLEDVFLLENRNGWIL
ncbi:hypothetical protein SLOPH_673 [Spraguea lophii 42_110]|uniref:Uncharacterized protein n=1 Tax=Spraguea lophii (strain 42_110) TaxID=1358809 RepID=S7WD90_SPRLO|nr:hypothetical protein SLOPH_673 [Spraguea lophii 42_110]